MSNHTRPDDLVDLESLLRQMLDVVLTAKAMPLSNSVLVSRDEMVDLLEESLERLPEEIRRARWVLHERDAFVERAEREAEDIIAGARAEAERLASQTQVVRQAEQRARRIIEDAEAEARRLRMEVDDYCDGQLAAFEAVLGRVAHSVSEGRSRLAAAAGQFEGPVGLEPEDMAVGEEVVPPLFDQDLQ